MGHGIEFAGRSGTHPVRAPGPNAMVETGRAQVNGGRGGHNSWESLFVRRQAAFRMSGLGRRAWSRVGVILKQAGLAGH